MQWTRNLLILIFISVALGDTELVANEIKSDVKTFNRGNGPPKHDTPASKCDCRE